jgi:hypothetical protein
MITIYGASDDLVEVDGCEGADEFGAYGSKANEVNWHGDLVAPGTGAAEQMRVTAIYDGCWHFAIGQVDEDVPLPPWGTGIGQHPEVSYSALLSIDAPAGTRLTNIWPAANQE